MSVFSRRGGECECVCVCVGVYVYLKGVHKGAWCSQDAKDWDFFPWGAKQGVQAQGSHQALEAGTQRAQKHIAHHTHSAGVRVYGCLCLSVSLQVSKHSFWDHI